MSKLVADSCVVIKWFVEEPGSAEAEKVLDAHLKGTWQLLVPDLIYSEISHVLWKKSRRLLITAAKAWRAIEALQRLKFTVTPSADLVAEAMRIAFDHDQSPYDCLYVALSNRQGCPLVTADEKLAGKLSRAFPQIVLLAAVE